MAQVTRTGAGFTVIPVDTLTFDPSVTGFPAEVGSLAYYNGTLYVKFGGGNTDWATSGGSAHVTAPLSGNGSVGSPFAIAPATDSTPGSMSAADKTAADKLNTAGIQTATTSGATPSVALAARKDVLQITVGADATQLTITGVSTDADFHYVLEGDIVGGGGAITLRPNGAANATSFRGFYITTAPLASGSPTGNFSLCDATDVGTVGGFIASVIGAPGAHKTIKSDQCVTQGAAVYLEHFVGQTLATTDITSLVLLCTSGSIKAGTTINLQRMRATT